MKDEGEESVGIRDGDPIVRKGKFNEGIRKDRRIAKRHEQQNKTITSKEDWR